MGTGTVALWRYRRNRRNYPGYHLAVDASACESLQRRLRELRPSESAVLDLSPPTPAILAVPNNGADVVHFKSLRVSLDVAARTLGFSEKHPRCELTLRPADRDELVKGLEAIAAGRGDYCIGEAEQHELWFWWWPR